jgi:hypothetical protein
MCSTEQEVLRPGSRAVVVGYKGGLAELLALQLGQMKVRSFKNMVMMAVWPDGVSFPSEEASCNFSASLPGPQEWMARRLNASYGKIDLASLEVLHGLSRTIH